MPDEELPKIVENFHKESSEEVISRGTTIKTYVTDEGTVFNLHHGGRLFNKKIYVKRTS